MRTIYPILALVVFLACSRAPTSPGIAAIAEGYVQLRARSDATLAIELNLPLAADTHLPDRSPSGIAALQSAEDSLNAVLHRVPPTDRATPQYAALVEELDARKALRVCHRELWSLSHIEGWQVAFPAAAALEHVATTAEKGQALRLWGDLPRYPDIDRENLRRGEAGGYSVPAPIVERVLEQLAGVIGSRADQSPLYSPAKRAGDSAFSASFRSLLERRVLPAIRDYRTFLRTEYLPGARQSLGIAALPNGDVCYRAYLRRYTTMNAAPGAVFADGANVVSQSTREILDLGRRKYGVGALEDIVRQERADPANRFRSPKELIEFSRAIVDRSIRVSRSQFVALPSQPVVVEPLPAYQRNTGVSSHYEANADDRRPATFRISTDDWRGQTRGAAEITAVHETIPGHHLQVAIARHAQSGKLEQLVFNAAYVEGWANYAERLAEETGVDGDEFERIERRVLAGRSLVIDPGIHAFGWSRERAERYAMEVGMSREAADAIIDRIVVEPGQLTSYELGGLTIAALRDTARSCLRRAFDIRTFHQWVLESGPLPLSALRAHVIDRIRAAAQPGCAAGGR